MTRILTALALMLLACTLLPAEDIAWQGFEQTQDTWTYQANSVTSGYWGLMDDVFGGASPHSGSQYWASWNMGSSEGILSFANQDLPLGYVYSLSFFYYTRLLSSPTEYSRYCLSYDNGLTWQEWITLLPNTQAWTQVTLEIPVQHRQLMLKVAARHGGTGKYAHWDSFLLSRIPAPPQAPVIYNLQSSQRTDGSGLVDIFYDLFDANNDPATISVLLSDNAGSTFGITPDPAFLSGDFGPAIALGTGKHIVWDAGAQGIALEGDQYKFRLLAEDYTTYGTVATPVFDPPGGTYYEAEQVSITCATDGAVIYYTTDGSEPTEASNLYLAPLSISVNTTLKAKAHMVGWLTSQEAISIYVINIVDVSFISVMGGTFHNMTSNVTLSSFYIDKYEITQESYQSIMGSNPSFFAGYPNRPVEQVTWYNAIEYCNRRSINEELIPCYSYGSFGTNPDNWPPGWDTNSANHVNVSCNWIANGYRLPTEMEWMFAAKGGNLSQGYTYSGSNDVSAVAWYNLTADNQSHGVGELAANELGIYDMSGNVYEWVWDIYGEYSSGGLTNPTGPDSGSWRLARGGCWTDSANTCTVYFRNNITATFTFRGMGFRCLRITLLSKVASPIFDPPPGTYEVEQIVSISCSTMQSSVYYTTDSSEPTEFSLLYSAPINISANTILKAKAFKSDWIPSSTAVGEYVIPPQGFIFVPSGSFTMGRTVGPGESFELPTHNVTLNSFYIGRYEVTQSEWQTVMGYNPAVGFGEGSNHPVYFVSWYDVLKYCNLRSIAEGLIPVYSISGSSDPANWGVVPASYNDNWNAAYCNWGANGYRLPTESEWEYAARGATNLPDYLYSGSDDADTVAWYSYNLSIGDYPPGVKPVGIKAPNGLGIYDMSGNVKEWCWDWFNGYSSNAQNNPYGPTSGDQRILRGGMFNSAIDYCQVSRRERFSPHLSEGSFGFRLCRSSDNMVFAEGGTFHNGISDVTLSSFYIDKYETTQASYQAVMGTNPSYFSNNPNRPVEQVSWFYAIEYCNRRSIQEGLTPCYSYSTYGINPANWPAGWNISDTNHTNISCNWSANGYRLPTEMEWMFAAMGGNQSQGYTYSGSNTIGNVAWYSSNSGSRTHNVGELAANELGLYDMSGNVWEWVWDIHTSSYPSGSQWNPTGPISGSYRIARGGTFNGFASYCTVAFRPIYAATSIDVNLGFRCVRRAP